MLPKNSQLMNGVISFTTAALSANASEQSFRSDFAKFCTKNNISRLLAEDFAGYSVKPKIMSIMTFILVTIALNFFYFSAFKKR